MITRNFGTSRGLVRLGLSYLESIPGISTARPPAPGSVRRLVFVCHGNICRSAFAEEVARQAGVNAASFGLSTSSGKGAHPPAAEAALALGYDLSAHVTTNLPDYAPQQGDYLLGMEFRHLRKLAADPRLRDLPRGVLGAWASPPVPHLHDPYRLDPAYMVTCLKRVESAVQHLANVCPNARSSPR